MGRHPFSVAVIPFREYQHGRPQGPSRKIFRKCISNLDDLKVDTEKIGPDLRHGVTPGSFPYDPTPQGFSAVF
jgi:hypothetical protein